LDDERLEFYGRVRPYFLAAHLAVVIVGVVWFVRSQPSIGSSRRLTGLNVLEERYARGEIDREEYLQKKRDLLG
jgi:putative membrane protein